ncbi:outer membrane protein assembly factor BamB family protein [Lentzea nigeriaca]|uniref:outer membrane protein assembly factor BamB family protein n=1 Tax=Lentzea nigeriaca TaxID=1128665 RepID=UPI00195D5F07|nr:PQQ-binding-like beta-propeller repeat protein [Lentzea nigeriaca]MBM7857102.1 polyvinyl alcohol dehydrogenase (cytochrome) [Lentzea nigeriaca]
MLKTSALLTAALVVLTASPATAHPGSDWAGWQKDLTGSRHNAAEWRLDQHNVGKLKLKWAFAYPLGEINHVRSQPAVVGDTIYFGGPDGKFYARNARTGAPKWEFTLPPAARYAYNSDGPTVSNGKVFFGDSAGRLFALDQRTGQQRWRAQMDDTIASMATSSPIVHNGLVYVGTSSGENVLPRDHACCTFRGHIDAYDIDTGALVWRHYTVPEPVEVGTWPNGAKRFEPSGAGVWSSPVIDRRTGTLYVGTGQNYTGKGGQFDSLLALDARTGAVKWANQVTDADTWRGACNDPDPEGYCPGLKDNTNLDYDIGSTPNLFEVDGRQLVGVGQKSGVYHVFDARTGQVVWRRQLGSPWPSGGIGGIQWGASYDGKRLYIATYIADPGKLLAVDPATGAVLWETPAPADGCSTGGAAGQPGCAPAHGVPVSSTPGVVWLGAQDGKFRAYDAKTGKILWTYDTVQDTQGVNGVIGRGGVIAGPGSGAVVSNGMVYVHSGHWAGYPSPYGRVLFAFGL